MTRQLVIESPEHDHRKRPVLTVSESNNVNDQDGVIHHKGNEFSNIGEVVGGTAAVCCCAPCAVIHIFALAVYRVPSGLYRKAWRKKKSIQRQRLLRKRNKHSSGLKPILPVGPTPIGLGLGLGLIHRNDDDDDYDEEDDDDDEEEILESGTLDMEMLEQFYRGFWRSPSQKEI